MARLYGLLASSLAEVERVRRRALLRGAQAERRLVHAALGVAARKGPFAATAAAAGGGEDAGGGEGGGDHVAQLAADELKADEKLVALPKTPPQPLDTLVPRLLALFSSERTRCREGALRCVSELVDGLSSSAIGANVSQLLQGLSALADDSNPSVRACVCRSKSGTLAISKASHTCIQPRKNSKLETVD